MTTFTLPALLTPLNIITATFLILLFRRLWVQFRKEEYALYASIYTVLGDPDDGAIEEIPLIASDFIMNWELWCWDFRHYIVHPKHYEDMMAFVRSQLGRHELSQDDIDQTMRRKAKARVATLAEKLKEMSPGIQIKVDNGGDPSSN